MARTLGDDGVVLIGATPVALIRNWDLNEAGSEVPMPAMGDQLEASLASKPKVTANVSAWYDDAGDAGQALIVQGASVTLQLRPKGTGSGLPQVELSGFEILEVDEKHERGAGSEINFSGVARLGIDRTAQV